MYHRWFVDRLAISWVIQLMWSDLSEVLHSDCVLLENTWKDLAFNRSTITCECDSWTVRWHFEIWPAATTPYFVVILSFYSAQLAYLWLKGSQVQNAIMSQKGRDQHELQLNTFAKRKHALEFWGLKNYAPNSQEIAKEHWDPWPEIVQHSCLFIFCYSSITTESKHTNTIKK